MEKFRKVDVTTGTEVPADSHSVYRTAMSSAGLKRPVRNAHRWRLWFCADYVRRLSGRLLAFFHPVETSTAPQWWSWRESNPRPECRPVAGITTMDGIMGAQALIYKGHAPTRLMPGNWATGCGERPSRAKPARGMARQGRKRHESGARKIAVFV